MNGVDFSAAKHYLMNFQDSICAYLEAQDGEALFEGRGGPGRRVLIERGGGLVDVGAADEEGGGQEGEGPEGHGRDPGRGSGKEGR